MRANKSVILIVAMLLAALAAFSTLAKVGVKLTVEPKSVDVGKAVTIKVENVGDVQLTYTLEVIRPDGGKDTLATNKVLPVGAAHSFSYTTTLTGDYKARVTFDSSEVTETFRAVEKDSDNDGIPDSRDNCPYDYNPSQSDNDRDGYGDACDSDDDNDGVPDSSDNCPYTPGPSWNNGCPPPPDSDGDGVPDSRDNCPNTYNPDQRNSDGDSLGDACDRCPYDYGPSWNNGCPTAVCGNGRCESGEDCRNCPQDCGKCGEPILPGEEPCALWSTSPLAALPEVHDARVIQRLIDSAKPGEIITLPEGIYVGSLLIKDKNDILLDGKDVLLIGVGKGNKPALQILNSSSITIKGLTITLGYQGIYIKNSSSITLEEDKIERSSWIGITILDSEVKILRSMITDNNGRGIVIHGRSRVTIQGNLIARNRILGLIVFGAGTARTEVTITGNQVINNLPSLKPIWGEHWGRGIEVHDAKAFIANNTIRSHPDVGLLLIRAEAEILNNEVTDTRGNFGRGIELQGSRATLMENVIINNEDIGLAIFTSTVRIRENVIRDNGHDLFVDQQSVVEEM